MLAGEGIELRHYVSIDETLNIMAEPDQALNPHASLSANGARKFVLKIGYYKYSSMFFHTICEKLSLHGLLFASHAHSIHKTTVV